MSPPKLADRGIGRRYNEDLSEDLIGGLLRQALGNDGEEMCMTVAKIKSYRTNLPFLVASPANNSGNPFPLVFAEEMYVPWRPIDRLIAYLLMSGGFIKVHSGGYEQSMTERGSPGAVYQP